MYGLTLHHDSRRQIADGAAVDIGQCGNLVAVCVVIEIKFCRGCLDALADSIQSLRILKEFSGQKQHADTIAGGSDLLPGGRGQLLLQFLQAVAHAIESGENLCGAVGISLKNAVE